MLPKQRKRKKRWGCGRNPSLETGRERTARLKKIRERRSAQLANETPEQKEARKQKDRDRRMRRQNIIAKDTAEKFVEDISRLIPQQRTKISKTKKVVEDTGDHPAISFEKCLGVKAEKIEPLAVTNDHPWSEEESSYEEESSEEEEETEQEHFKLNSFKIKCFDIQRDIDKAQVLLKQEKEKAAKMSLEMQELRLKAANLEEMYEIPII